MFYEIDVDDKCKMYTCQTFHLRLREQQYPACIFVVVSYYWLKGEINKNNNFNN